MTLYDDAVRTLSTWDAPPLAKADHEKTLRLLETGPEVLTVEHREVGHVTASGIILSHDRRSFLLCLHGRFNIWVQLGGHLEPEDGSLAAAALREATEESGIDGLWVDPVPVDLDVHEVRCRGGSPLLHHDVIYGLVAPEGAVEQVSSESHQLGWFTVDDLPSPLGTDTARVIASALARLG